ncbi:hypothetical protein DN068_11760 [Taibaiella soli]|uniref:Uncharacterized protein n=2 Tax=Taibaiella soli TaxID=1649169 RepID=A0A2W2AX31_9BACT|nr:hypothetical protein DN068_11760 [Taibaiella soli]
MHSFAQKGYTEKQLSRKPVWTDMMKDTSANFFEVEKAYKTYWANHELPDEEAEGKNKEPEQKLSRRERKEQQAVMELSLDVKRYQMWRESVLPWVQDNGRIRPQAERLAIWKAQQTNITK